MFRSTNISVDIFLDNIDESKVDDMSKFESNDEDSISYNFPARKEICHRCDGEGQHTNPNVDGHGITAEEWHNEWNEDEREGYMNGRYDVVCEECKGNKIVMVIDEEAIQSNGTEECRTMYTVYQKQLEDKAASDYEDAQTRRMECGGYE